jgi:hypothetical protein
MTPVNTPHSIETTLVRGPNKKATTGPFSPRSPRWIWATVAFLKFLKTNLNSSRCLSSMSLNSTSPLALVATVGTSLSPLSLPKNSLISTHSCL